jgi:cell division protein FtsL
MAFVSWLYVALLACAVAVLVAAEWTRLAAKAGIDRRRSRKRAKRKANLRLLRSESEEFAASVERDLSRLPTIEERDSRRR